MRWAFGALALLCLLADDSHAANSQAELYGKSREVRSLSISPNGQQIAYLYTIKGETSLVARPIDGEGGVRVNVDGIKPRSVEWSGPNHVLLYASQTENNYAFSSPLIEFWAVFSVDVRTGKSVQLLGRSRSMDLQSSLANVRGKTWDEDGTVFMAARTSAIRRRNSSVGVAGYTRGDYDLYEVDGNTGRGSRIAKGKSNTDNWLVQSDGSVVARVDHSDKSNRYRILAPQDRTLGRNWDEIYAEETEIPNLSIYGTNADDTALIIGTRLKTDRFALFEMTIADGAISPTALYEHEFVDVSSILTDEYTGQVVGAEIVYAAREQRFFQGEFVRVVDAAKKALPDGYRVYLEDWDRDRKRFIFFAQSDSDSGIYLLLDTNKGDLKLIARAYPEVGQEALSPVKPFVYKTRDNVTIQGYLTIPKGAEAKNLPLVAMPHGGPESRDEMGYDWWSQFIAAQGYAVVQMNFRGSWGYGINFTNAGYGEWGGAMQDDVTDGVNHLVAEGIADPDRICIVGGSYGGYAAMAGAAFTPDLYKCAMSYSGVTDLNRKFRWVKKRFGAKSSTYEYWLKNMGEPGKELDGRSPALAADQIKADVLLIHGKDDTVVDIEQSEVMAEKLEKAGRPHEFIILDGEDHWLSTEETRVAMLEALGGFLEKHLGPDAESAKEN